MELDRALDFNNAFGESRDCHHYLLLFFGSLGLSINQPSSQDYDPVKARFAFVVEFCQYVLYKEELVNNNSL